VIFFATGSGGFRRSLEQVFSSALAMPLCGLSRRKELSMKRIVSLVVLAIAGLIVSHFAQASLPEAPERSWTGSKYDYFHNSRIGLRSVEILLWTNSNRAVMIDLTYKNFHEGSYRYRNEGKDIMMNFPQIKETWWGSFVGPNAIKGYVDYGSGSQGNFTITRSK
jgi:hypothetical protein